MDDLLFVNISNFQTQCEGHMYKIHQLHIDILRSFKTNLSGYLKY